MLFKTCSTKVASKPVDLTWCWKVAFHTKGLDVIPKATLANGYIRSFRFSLVESSTHRKCRKSGSSGSTEIFKNAFSKSPVKICQRSKVTMADPHINNHWGWVDFVQTWHWHHTWLEASWFDYHVLHLIQALTPQYILGYSLQTRNSQKLPLRF